MDFSGNDATTDLPLRLGGRVLLFDAEGKLLLMEDSDPADPSKGSWWITPGGGLEPGEDPAQAARRELLEETGLSIESVHGPVGTSEFVLTFQGVHTLQRDSFFHARAPEGSASEIQLTTAEQASLKGSRWWSPAEIEAGEATILPANLADLVRQAQGTQAQENQAHSLG